MIRPSPEQQRACELFLKQEGLRIDAYAGSGKTTTLQMLAGSTSRRGLYLAFNRSIADAARHKFPQQVSCATSHSIAFRTVRQRFGYPEWKLIGALTPNSVVGTFRMPETLTFRSGLALPKWSYCSILLDGVRRFLQSDDAQPERKHIPRYGCLEALADSSFDDFTQQAIAHVQAIWESMLHKGAGLPLGHDGYLKLWALSEPRANVDYILVDEAQDLNPVLLGVLRNLFCPVVYVGDPYQQIYEWRGAVNAMAQVSTPHQVLLSQSYRFGPVIANAASTIIRELGAKHPVRGVTGMESHLTSLRPEVILCRSNVGVIGNVIRYLSRELRCHVLGGTEGLEALLTDVKRVKQGAGAHSPELLGFTTWKDVMSFSGQAEGEYLRGLVNLVQEYGEDIMLRALSRCEAAESSASVVCATAHKAKGREWRHVTVDSDFEVAISRSSPSINSDRKASLEAEFRLLYVAVTRAMTAVQLPHSILERFSLRVTTDKLLGTDDRTSVKTPDPADDSALSGVISPYHSPRAGESREMASLRRILG
jgi:superfamily I DNA/RNA helicase